jgi:uncharacterized membrane protein YgcG
MRTDFPRTLAPMGGKSREAARAWAARADSASLWHQLRLRWSTLIGLLLLALLACALTPQQAPAAPRLSAALPKTILAGHALSVRGRAYGFHSGTQAVLQQRVGGTWKRRAAAKLHAPKPAFVLRWTLPDRAGVVTLRVALLKSGKVVARTKPRRVAMRRTVLKSVARRSTVEVSPAETLDVNGDPNATQTITLSRSAPHPRVGGVLVIPSSAHGPQGVLGLVKAVRTKRNGKVVVRTRPATLDEAYSKYELGVSGTLGELEHAAGMAATAASVARFKVVGAEMDCKKGAGAGPSVAFNADFSPVEFDLTLVTGASSYAPRIYFSMQGKPTFDLDAALKAHQSCTYKGHLQIIIPIPGTALQVLLRPAFSFGVDGAFGLRVHWSPFISVVFARGKGVQPVNTNVITQGKPTLKPLGEAAGDVFLGAQADLTLGGRVGVSANVGPNLKASVSRDSGVCLGIDGSLKTALNAYADVFVKHWDFALVSGEFLKQPLWSSCRPPGGGGGSGGGGSGGGGSGGGGSGGGGSGGGGSVTVDLPAAWRGYLYRAFLGTNPYLDHLNQVAVSSSPPGLHLLDGGAVTGVPTTTGAFAFHANWLFDEVADGGDFAVNVTDAPASLPANALAHLGTVGEGSTLTALRPSPDGKYLAVTLGYPEVVALYDLTSHALRPLTSGSDRSGIGYGAWTANLGWSPNGRYLAFTSTEPLLGPTANGPWYNVYLYDTESDELSRLTNGSQGDSYNPAWSPDGELLTFAQSGSCCNDQRVAVYNSTTRATAILPCPVDKGCRAIASSDDISSEPWSADSMHLTYLVVSDYYDVHEVVVWDRATDSSRSIVTGAISARLSPDGLRVAANVGLDDSVIDVATGARLHTAIGVNLGFSSQSMNDVSVWSPNGKYVTGRSCDATYCGPAVLDVGDGTVTHIPAKSYSEFAGWKGHVPMWCVHPSEGGLDCEGIDVNTGALVSRHVDVRGRLLYTKEDQYFASDTQGTGDLRGYAVVLRGDW